MTEQDKVTVDDIIGIVKTEEQTNSVEEVRKLRGRENKTAKRYFKRMWEEEYYIFDSNTISESDFEEKLEYQNYKAFEDSMMGDEVVNRLNEQHETIQRLQKDNKILMDKMFEMRTNKALNRTEISNQSYTVDEFLEELEKW